MRKKLAVTATTTCPNKSVSSWLGNRGFHITTAYHNIGAETKTLNARNVFPTSLHPLTDRGKTLDLRHSLGCSDKKYHGNQRAAAPILAHLQLSYIPRKRNTTWNTGLRLSLGLLEQLEPTAETVMLVVLLGFLAAISFLSVAGAKARTGLNRTIGAAT